MKGFFKRDLYLILPNVKIYVVFVLVMGLVCRKTSLGMGFLDLYVAIFATSAIMGLFACDMQGWAAFAAATRDGRRLQVRGRYLLSLLVCLVAGGVMIGMEQLAGGGGVWPGALLFLPMMLFYTALLLPISYRFGQRSRLILLLIIGLTAGIAGGLTAVTTIGGTGPEQALAQAGPLLWAVLILAALAALALSYRISIGITRKMEY